MAHKAEEVCPLRHPPGPSFTHKIYLFALLAAVLLSGANARGTELCPPAYEALLPAKTFAPYVSRTLLRHSYRESEKTFLSQAMLPGNRQRDRQMRVPYFSEQRRRAYQIFVHDGGLYDARGWLLGGNGKLILEYVMDPKGNLYVNLPALRRRDLYWHHSSPLAGEPAAAAGIMEVEAGRALELNNDSGHYAQAKKFPGQAALRLRELGADLSRLRVSDRFGRPVRSWERFTAREREEAARTDEVNRAGNLP